MLSASQTDAVCDLYIFFHLSLKMMEGKKNPEGAGILLFSFFIADSIVHQGTRQFFLKMHEEIPHDRIDLVFVYIEFYSFRKTEHQKNPCVSGDFFGFYLTIIGITVFLKIGEVLFGISIQHEAGYICAMLFIIPGFPFITSGIDLAKLDMRSGTERLMYALIIILVAAMSAWIMALLLHLKPVDFIKISLPVGLWILFRFLASFCGVFGFSIMFNSPVRLAASAATIGAIANTLRLELVDLAGMPPAAAAFVGALTAGLLASLIKNKAGYPRISLTVPSIVIMVPGLYLYRGFYNLGVMSLSTAASWFAAALLIIAALPLGLIFARILTDRTFRYCT